MAGDPSSSAEGCGRWTHGDGDVSRSSVQLACAALYLYPRTAVLGVILWTGYLGGAVATHVRVGDPLFSHVLFPIYVASLLWLGLWLREPRLHAFVPLGAARRATDGPRGDARGDG